MIDREYKLVKQKEWTLLRFFSHLGNTYMLAHPHVIIQHFVHIPIDVLCRMVPHSV